MEISYPCKRKVYHDLGPEPRTSPFLHAINTIFNEMLFQLSSNLLITLLKPIFTWIWSFQKIILEIMRKISEKFFWKAIIQHPANHETNTASLIFVNRQNLTFFDTSIWNSITWPSLSEMLVWIQWLLKLLTIVYKGFAKIMSFVV